MNSKRGSITIHALGQAYTLQVTTNAMVRYQDQAGETFVVGLTSLQDDPSDMRRLRSLFASAMNADVETAGNVMDDLGLQVAIEKLSEAAALAFPKEEGEPEGNAPEAENIFAQKETTLTGS